LTLFSLAAAVVIDLVQAHVCSLHWPQLRSQSCILHLLLSSVWCMFVCLAYGQRLLSLPAPAVAGAGCGHVVACIFVSLASDGSVPSLHEHWRAQGRQWLAPVASTGCVNNMPFHLEFGLRGIYKNPRPVALGLNGVVHLSWRHLLCNGQEGRGHVPEVQQRLHRREEELLVPEVLRGAVAVASMSSAPFAPINCQFLPAGAAAARLAGNAS